MDVSSNRIAVAFKPMNIRLSSDSYCNGCPNLCYDIQNDECKVEPRSKVLEHQVKRVAVDRAVTLS